MHMYILPCKMQITVHTRGHSRMSQDSCTCQKNSSNYKSEDAPSDDNL